MSNIQGAIDHIEDWIGGNIPVGAGFDAMGLTVLLRSELERVWREALREAGQAACDCENAGHTNTIYRGDAVRAIQALAGQLGVGNVLATAAETALRRKAVATRIAAEIVGEVYTDAMRHEFDRENVSRLNEAIRALLEAVRGADGA